MNDAIVAIVAAVLVSATPAFAVGLTGGDYEFLAGHDIERTSTVLRDLSPKEQARLHALINDARTINDPAARAAIVDKALQEFKEHQAWETANPGRLWDVPKR
jgi:hypothetical protein